VDARGCDPARLTKPEVLAALFDEIVADLDLHVVGTPVWHKFPGPGGVTGVALLSESHLTLHTFPEHSSLCLNLFCCRPRPELDWEALLEQSVGATEVDVRRVKREYIEAAALKVGSS
jgi:S-adenosylmethionine decarboxylase